MGEKIRKSPQPRHVTKTGVGSEADASDANGVQGDGFQGGRWSSVASPQHRLHYSRTRADQQGSSREHDATDRIERKVARE